MSLMYQIMEPIGNVSDVGLILGTLLIAAVIWFIKYIGHDTLTAILKDIRGDQWYHYVPGPDPHWLYGKGENHKEVNVKSRENLDRSVDEAVRFGYLVRKRLGPLRYKLLVSEPDTARGIFSAPTPKADYIRKALSFLGSGLLESNGSVWHRKRKLLTPGFHYEILRSYVSVFQECTEEMIMIWKNRVQHDKKIEICEYTTKLMLDTLLKCAFRYDSGVQIKGNAYIEALQEVAEISDKRVFSAYLIYDPIFYLSREGRRYRKAQRYVNDFADHVIKARRKDMLTKKDEDKKYIDFLDILLSAKDENGNGFSDDEIRDEVNTFMFAGHDTTASAISWFLYNMARNPEHQEKCFEEILDVLADGEVTWEALKNLEYLTLCIKESLRLHPPVYEITRQLDKDFKIKTGVNIPNGTPTALNIYGLHHNPSIWQDAEKFDPLRFTPENTTGRSPHAYLPFSTGPRNCIGQQFALTELKTSAALILRNFRLSVGDNPEPIKEGRLVTKSSNGIWLDVEIRQ